jgi:competence protein ComEC
MHVRDLPAVKYLLIISLGIGLGLLIKPSVYIAAGLLCLILMIFIFVRKKKITTLLLFLCVLSCGVLRVSLYKDQYNIRHKIPEGRDSLRIHVMAQKTSPFRIESYVIKTSICNLSIKGTLYAKRGMPVLIPGQSYLMSDITWRPITADPNPYTFNYLNYARVKGISHSFQLQKNTEIKEEGIFNPLLFTAHRLKNEIAVRYLSVLGIEKGSLVNGLLLGLKSEIPSCLADLFRQLGISHLLAVSGLHVGLIMLIMYQMLLIFSVPRVPRALFVGLFLMFYCFITGGSPSVIRSSLMTLMLLLAPVFQRKYQALNAVAAAAVILLLVNPLSLLDLGFQFSFSAVFGILIAYPKIRLWFGKKKRNKFSSYIIDMISVSLSAALFTSPVAIFYFNSLQMASMLLNIIVIPLTFCVMICAILTLPGLFLHGIFANGFLYALDISLSVFRAVLRLASRSGIWTLTVSSYWKPLVMCVVIICLILICFNERKIKTVGLLICVLTCLSWFIQNTRPELIQPDFKKGRSLLVRKGRTALIINTGSRYYNYNDHERTIRPILDHWGVKNVIMLIGEWQKQNIGNIGNLLRTHPGSPVLAASVDDGIDLKVTKIESDTTITFAGDELKVISENKKLFAEFMIWHHKINYRNDTLFVDGKAMTERYSRSYGNILYRRE